MNCRFISAGGNYGSACESVSAQNGSGNEYAFQNTKAGFLVLPVPDRDDLSELTELVAQNNGFNLDLSERDRETMRFLRHHIQHVIYIVKENRTFDQILGDLQNGANGDPALTQFPQKVTPNFHSIATNFVTLDNFYDSGIVSMDGWQWSTAARALDLNEKSVVINYGKGGAKSLRTVKRTAAAKHQYPRAAVVGVAARKAWQPLYPPDPDLLPGTRNEVAADGPEGEEGKGYIWDAALRAGLSVRNYGFLLDLGAVQGLDPNLTAPCSKTPPVQVAFPAHPSLLGVTDFCFRGFDQAFPDFFRYQEWAREFDGYVKNNNLPSLELVRFQPRPFRQLRERVLRCEYSGTADRRRRLRGRVAGGQDRSQPIRQQHSAVFVLEDDPQDGADHAQRRGSAASAWWWVLMREAGRGRIHALRNRKHVAHD